MCVVVDPDNVPYTPYGVSYNKRKPRIKHFHIFEFPMVFKRYKPQYQNENVARGKSDQMCMPMHI